MNVNKDNFDDVFKEIESLMPSACLISIDEEMTGISLPGQRRFSVLESSEDRYKVMRQVASTYTMIQFGLCLFHRQDDGSILARPYNIYVFPASGSICMEGSAIAFNKKHNMDFNQWMYKGVTYVSGAEQEEKLRKKLFPVEQQAQSGVEPAAAPAPPAPLTFRNPADESFVKEQLQIIRTWHGTAATDDNKMLELPECNSFLRLALRRGVEAEFPDLFVESRELEQAWKKVLVLLRLSPVELAARQAEKLQAKQREFESALGARRLFHLLTACKVPLTGHNCFYDLLFMLDCFGDLPDDLAGFKATTSAAFPVIYDTKHLAETKLLKTVTTAEGETKPRFKSTALGDVYEVVKAENALESCEVKIEFAEGFDRYGPDSTNFHEAAFDAYITGFVMLHFLPVVISAQAEQRAGQGWDLHLKNVLPIYGSLYAVHLAGDDAFLWSDKALYHCSFPSSVCTADLKRTFNDIEHAYVRWVNGTEALMMVPVADKDKADTCIGSHDELEIKVVAWDEYRQALADEASGEAATVDSAHEPATKKRKVDA